MNIDLSVIQKSYWENLLDKFILWSSTELPAIIVLIIIFLIVLRLFKSASIRLRKLILKYAVKHSEDEDPIEKEKRTETLTAILYGALKLFMWALFIITLLGKFGIDLAPLIAGAGIVGLAIGWGAQELVRDGISGFFIILENQLRRGDVAIINGTGGLVENIALRTITLRDFSGVVHIFQNGKIDSMANMTKQWSAIVFDIGVAYKEDVEQVIEIMKEVGGNMMAEDFWSEKIINELEVFGLDSFGASAVIIKARFKTKPSMQWEVGREFRKRLKAKFDEDAIEIPFPHTTVYWGEKINPLRMKMEQMTQSTSKP